MNVNAKALDGLGILITRPEKQAHTLAKRLEKIGAVPVLLPTIEIAPPQDTQPLRDALAQLDAYDFVMFVSPNAVEQALATLPQQAKTQWPKTVQALAPGKGTAAALQQAGVPVESILMPISRFDSEGLLELPTLQNMQGKRVLILRGEQGRELLSETLTARGAEVTRVACYRRICPTENVDLLPLLQSSRLCAITATSAEALDNLETMAGSLASGLLKTRPVFVTHPRIAAHGRERGWLAIDTSEENGEDSDSKLICGMIVFFASL
ncbi:MAG: uroporphyrinogen-III synthase [Burkholderiales bacterium]|nr:uroporphyrinogen-III synthase [Burkholderiales bacterium]